jgi:hypothetical protein
MKKLAIVVLCALVRMSSVAQESHEIIYSLDCPTDWQDSIMALETEPAMVLYCSGLQSVVVTHDPFGQCIDSRLMDIPSWSQKSAKGYWVQYKEEGEEVDSTLLAFSFNVEGKSKKAASILGYTTKTAFARSPAYSKEKIELTYTEDLRGVHPWCLGLRGIPLRIVIPTELGNYVLEAKSVSPRMTPDFPQSPNGTVRTDTGQSVKEHFFYDSDSTSMIVFGTVTDEFNDHLLGLVDVKVFEKEALIASTRTDLRGAYDLRLKTGRIYTLEIGTAPYVTKRIQVDLLTMRPRGDNPALQLDGSIFQNPKNVDCSLLKAPILKLYYDMNTKDIAFDINYNDARKAQLDLLLEQIK